MHQQQSYVKKMMFGVKVGDAVQFSLCFRRKENENENEKEKKQTFSGVVLEVNWKKATVGFEFYEHPVRISIPYCKLQPLKNNLSVSSFPVSLFFFQTQRTKTKRKLSDKERLVYVERNVAWIDKNLRICEGKVVSVKGRKVNACVQLETGEKFDVPYRELVLTDTQDSDGLGSLLKAAEFLERHIQLNQSRKRKRKR